MMPLSEILFLAIVVYLLYRFIVNFLLPVVRATRHVREQFRDMPGGSNQQKQQGYRPEQPSGASRTANATGTAGATSAASTTGAASGRQSSTRPPAEDYIDFEEIK
jgi:hypothetical protein